MISIRRAAADGIPVAAVAVAGVVCCAGLPALATLLGGLALAAVLGVAGGLLLLAALAGGALVVLRAWWRRRCASAEATRE